MQPGLLEPVLGLLSWAGLLAVAQEARRRNQADGSALLQTERLLQEEMRLLQERRHTLLSDIRTQEEKIREIAEGYGISKQFLATLDLEEILRMMEEILFTEFPFLSEDKRREYVKAIRGQIDRQAILKEALLKEMPLTDFSQELRPRWERMAGQFFLGLKRASLYAQVQALASHDGLTGLFSRRHFQERLKEEVIRSLRRERPVAFLMVDLDHFKKVNDTYGHLVGDVVLREVAALIRRSVREVDLGSRFGGEEFAVVLPETSREVAMAVAQRIRMLIEGTLIPAYDEKISVTVSIGVAVCPENARSAEQLIERADSAMYQAKAAGRNKVVPA